MNDSRSEDIVMHAIRIAEKGHRTRSQGPHLRKAPRGEDRPYYFVHLAEVAWILSDAGCDRELVAAGYLHDLIEDCGYTGEQLEQEIGNKRVVMLVEAVSEPGTIGDTGKKMSWEKRNANYLDSMVKASADVLTLSCVDKTVNLMEMCHWLDRGYQTEEFTSRDHATQLAKFDALGEAYLGKVADRPYTRFVDWLEIFRSLAPGSRGAGERATPQKACLQGGSMRERRVGRPIGERNEEELNKNIERMMGHLVKNLNAGALAEEARQKAERRNTLRSGLAFDEETYKKAKPLFVSAWVSVKDLGYSVKELAKYYFEQYGERIRPYLKQFLLDVQSGNIETTPLPDKNLTDAPQGDTIEGKGGDDNGRQKQGDLSGTIREDGKTVENDSDRTLGGLETEGGQATDRGETPAGGSTEGG